MTRRLTRRPPPSRRKPSSGRAFPRWRRRARPADDPPAFTRGCDRPGRGISSSSTDTMSSAFPRRAARDELAVVDEPDRADVHAARGWPMTARAVRSQSRARGRASAGYRRDRRGAASSGERASRRHSAPRSPQNRPRAVTARDSTCASVAEIELAIGDRAPRPCSRSGTCAVRAGAVPCGSPRVTWSRPPSCSIRPRRGCRPASRAT